MLFQYYILWPITERGGAQPSSLRLRLRLGTPGKPFEWRANVILKRLTRLHRGDAEVAEAGSGSRFSRSNPQTSRSVISAPPRGSSSSRRRCNLEKALQITSRRRGEAEVAEAESWRMFSGSNPQTSRSAISAPPRGSSSSSRRCNLDGQSPREDVRSRVGRSRPGKPVEWVCVCQSLVAAAGGPRRYWRARGVRPNAARSEIAPCLLWRACGAPHPPCRNVRVRSLAIPGGVVHAEADLAGHATGDDVACEPGGLGLRLSRLRGAVRKSRP